MKKSSLNSIRSINFIDEKFTETCYLLYIIEAMLIILDAKLKKKILFYSEE